MTSLKTIKRKFGIVFNDISHLVEYKSFFQEYQNFVQTNPVIDKQNDFLYFICLNYIEATTLGIFRQVDKNWKSQSLRKVLLDILHNYKLFTYKRFSSKYKGLMMKSMARRDFAKFSTKNGKIINRVLIKKDMSELLRVTKPIIKYRHKVVAHKNKRPVSISAKVNDLYGSIDCLERMVIKYQLLLNQSGMNTLLAGNSNPRLKDIFKQ